MSVPLYYFMKKIAFLFLIFFGFLSAVYAQDDTPLHTRAGFKTGLNYANITGDAEGTDARIRMHLGAVIEFPISQQIYIQTEVLYSAQGYTIDQNGTENKISLNYLTLPVIGKFYFGDHFSLETGPRFATLANATESADDTTDEFFDSFNNFDFGWVVGAGYKFESGLFFQLHYNIGLSNINDIDGLDITNNTALGQLSVGYLFKTKNNRRQEPAVDQ